MSSAEVKNVLDMLIHYNLFIYEHVTSILLQLGFFRNPYDFQLLVREESLRIKLDRLCNELKDEVAELLKFRKFAIRVWLLIKKFDPFDRDLLEKELKEDFQIMIADISLLTKLSDELKLTLDNTRMWMKDPTIIAKYSSKGSNVNNDPLFVKYAKLHQKFEQIANNFIKIIQKGIYKEKFIKDYTDVIYRYWQTRIHNQVGWLYHGTSILFLRNIQIHGLDNSKISKGIKRAIEIISKIYQSYGIDYKSANIALDTDAELAKRPISLTGNEDVVSAAKAVNLPGFLYELLDESALKEEPKKALLSALPEEEKFMVRAIWRFGKILRKKNKIMMLYIKVDSRFLKYYNMPDFIGDYEEFLKVFMHPYIKRIDSGKYSNYNLTRILYDIPILGKSIGYLTLLLFMGKGIPKEQSEYFTVGTYEIRVAQVPQEFIYIKVAGKFVPISKVTESMVPFIE